MDERIPTIFDEEALPNSRGPNIAPPSELILAVAQRAHGSYGYRNALEKNGISIEQVQYPIADALHAKYMREKFIRDKKQKRDNAKKTGNRWNEKKSNRDRQLNKLTKVVSRKIFATEESARFQADKKEHAYYPDLLKWLAHIFIATKKPYRLITATLLLFNLSSHMPCENKEKKCKHFKRPRGRKPKEPDAALDVTRGNNLCNKQRLFECPHFSKTENKVRRMLNRLK